MKRQTKQHVMKEKALATRIEAMDAIGWAYGNEPQQDWKECLETLLRTCCGNNLNNLAFLVGINPGTIRNDAFQLKINKKKNIHGGWEGPRAKKASSPIAAYCRRTGVSYSTVYGRMRKFKAAGMDEDDAMRAAMKTDKSLPGPKIDTKKIIDPRHMTKKQRRGYLLNKAREYGILREERAPRGSIISFDHLLINGSICREVEDAFYGSDLYYGMGG